MRKQLSIKKLRAMLLQLHHIKLQARNKIANTLGQRFYNVPLQKKKSIPMALKSLAGYF